MRIHKGSTGRNLSWSDSHHLMNKIFPAKFPIAPLEGDPLRLTVIWKTLKMDLDILNFGDCISKRQFPFQ